jgi:hypothetical protein
MASRQWSGWRKSAVVGAGLAVAIGCSSSNNNAGQGSDGGSGSGGGSGYCPTDTSVSAGAGYASNPAGDNSAPGCPSCHTSDMGGTSTPLSQYVATGNYLYPPNLTPDMTTGVGSWRDNDLALAITEGIDNQSERLCPQMQHYPGMCTSEVNGVIAWLRSLPAVSRQVPRSICPPLKSNPDGGI